MTSPNERRAAILKAATRLFEHYGHGKTTIAEVAREARIGVGTVYLEFDSKEAIVEELSLSTHAGVLEAMRAASDVSDDHAARLAAVLHARTRCFLELRKKGQHACELVHCKTEGVRAVHDRFREQEHALLTVLVAEGRDAGAFAACAPESIAALLQRAFASLSPPWIFGGDDDAIRASNELCQLLLHGLLASKRPLALLATSRAAQRVPASATPKARATNDAVRKPARRRR
ncbi:MAG: TetR/AcrR family transcriptional regulator [Labilithrix sp.]|nr:TetR/AcrR family transcriptional regulator [Labilithrix sp.]